MNFKTEKLGPHMAAAVSDIDLNRLPDPAMANDCVKNDVFDYWEVCRPLLADPELKKRALNLGIDAEASTPAEIDARMKSDIAKWTKVIEDAHIPKQ